MKTNILEPQPLDETRKFELDMREVPHEKLAHELRRKFAAQVKELSQIQSWKSQLAFATDWAIVLGSAWLCSHSFHPLLYIATLFVIAGRQHALLILVHEAVHYRLSPKKGLNDFLSDYFAALPILFDTEIYRRNHMEHHKHLNTDQDPDWSRKIELEEWQFPMPRKKAWRTLPAYVLYNGPKEWLTYGLYFSGLISLGKGWRPEHRRQFYKRLLYYGSFSLLFSYAGLWQEFLLYWAVPFFLIFPTLQRVRSVAEHFGLSRTHELNSSRNVLSPWYERFFLAPHSINFHIIHHVFPSIPFYNLNKLSRALSTDPAYQRHAHQNTSYVLPSRYPIAKDLFGERPTAQPPQAQLSA